MATQENHRFFKMIFEYIFSGLGPLILSWAGPGPKKEKLGLSATGLDSAQPRGLG